MTENAVLIETSFADAIAIIAAAPELPEQTRRHWSSSLRQIAKALDKPVQVIPARYSAVRADLVHLHHAPAGLTAKTLQNHKSNAKSALLWLAREKGVPEHGAPLTPVWQDLWSEIGDALVRSRLSSLTRFCSANKIVPAEVDEAALDRFMDYRSRTGSCSDDACWRGHGTRMLGPSRAGPCARLRCRWPSLPLSRSGRISPQDCAGMSSNISRA